MMLMLMLCALLLLLQVPYDLFPSGYLTVMLAQGYNNTGIYGGLSATIEEEMTRAAWTHLLMQSPWGERAAAVRSGGRGASGLEVVHA